MAGMVSVSAEGDKVVLDLHGRRRDVLLSPLDALRLADALDEKAAGAERAAPELVRGEVWNVHVTSFDRKVALRFTPPLGVTCGRVPMPAGAARRVAELLRSNAELAGYGMRIRVVPGG
jgi:hypothetical protein